MHRRFAVLLSLAALGFCLTLASAATAADAPAGGHGQAEHKPSPFEGALDLTIWTWVVFVLLFLVLRKYAWKPMLEGLQAREANIHQAMEEARKAREEAEAARARYTKEIEQANDKIRAMMEEAHRDAEALRDRERARGEEEAREFLEKARRDIRTERDQAVQELWNQSAQLAALISTKTIRRELKAEDHRRFVDEALAEMRQAAKAS